jgi:hypothetical protein
MNTRFRGQSGSICETSLHAAGSVALRTDGDRIMKSLIAAAALAVSAAALAAPAHADPREAPGYSRAAPDYRPAAHDDYRGDPRGPYGDYRRGGYRDTFSRDDLARMEARIDRGFRSGQLTRREARYLSRELYDLRERARYYWRTDGMSWRERRDLDARYLNLREQIRRQVRDDDRRWDGDYRGEPRRY